MNGAPLTSADLDAALDQIWRQGGRVCPHAVHPRHRNRRLALAAEEVDVFVLCGMCGAVLALTKPEKDA